MSKEELKELIGKIGLDVVLRRMSQQQPNWEHAWASQQDLRDAIEQADTHRDEMLRDRQGRKVRLVLRAFVMELMRQASD